MKLKIFFTSILSAIAMLATLTGCEDEKDLIIIDGNLPIKTSTLYMVGDATPTGWDIASPTALTASAADPLVFEWEGTLNAGEMKLCLTPGSFDASFIRPMESDAPISSTDITDAEFQMHAGDPDEKWRVTEAGKYHLTFNLRNWTMSTRFLGGAEVPPVDDDLTSETLYMIGDATPGGWSMDDATAFTRSADDGNIFTWQGELKTGKMKACLEQDGTFSCPFLRPSSADVAINSAGVAASDFVYTTGPDDQWEVKEAGEYKITFDLKNKTIKVEYLKAPEGGDDSDNNTLETNTLYMIGDATPGGWSMDNLTALTQSPDDANIFTWTGELKEGRMKACLEPDGTFSCPFLRPSSADVVINSAGVAASDFVYTTDPDDQWNVTEAGKYQITFDLKNRTIQVSPVK